MHIHILNVPVHKTENMAVGIHHADHVTFFICKKVGTNFAAVAHLGTEAMKF
jgi:hypothetical protein